MMTYRPQIIDQAATPADSSPRARCRCARVIALIAMAFSALSLQCSLPDSARAQPLLLQNRQPTAAPRVPVNIAKWCADYRRGSASWHPFANDTNLMRLKVAQSELAPDFDPGSRRDGIALLSAYQEELERRHPDQSSAATYLAMASVVPITAKVVARVNALLCVSSTRAFANAITVTAETIRQQMTH